MITPEEHERVFHWLYGLSHDAPFDIKSTAAPAYRRVAIQRARQAHPASDDAPATMAGAGYRFEDGLARPTRE